jgi:zinc and cadmium transporter
MSPLVYSLIATMLVSLISLIGVVLFVTKWSERLEVAALSFAAGVLLATTFLELLPEAIGARAGDNNILVATLASIVGFFLLERFLSWWHIHPDEHTGHAGFLILVGDGVHNFIDGVVIAAAFLLGPGAGIATTLAVAAHEIPHEMADYGVLIGSKFSRRNALILNFLSGLTALLGAIVCFLFRSFVEPNLPWFMAASGGMFIYIAAAGLIPELHHARWRSLWVTTLPLLAGIALMAALKTLTQH